MDEQDADENTLAALAEAGSILTKEHSMDFFLYFDEEAQARETDEKIRSVWPQLVADIQESEDTGNWVIAYTGKMVPTIETLRALRTTFEESGADYDGWGAEIVRE